jgi:hypothetical protein
MSNGYLIAAGPDLVAAHEISDGFGLDVIDPASVGDIEAAGPALAAAANLGVLLSTAGAADSAFVALLQSAAAHAQRAQLILVDADARAAFPFLPEAWPAMSLDEARSRSAELVRRRDTPADSEPAQAAPLPPAPAPEASIEQPPQEAPVEHASEAAPDQPGEEASEQESALEAPTADESAPAMNFPSLSQAGDPDAPPSWMAEGTTRNADGTLSLPAAPIETPAAQDAAPVGAAPSPELPPAAPAPAAAPPPSIAQEMASGAPQAPAPSAPPKRGGRKAAPDRTAPADATAFAPKKLRRGTPEIIQIAIHQPKDLKAAIKAAKTLDPRADAAPQGVNVGDIALGATIGVALEAHGGACNGDLQRQTWNGDPLSFVFSFEADDEAKQAVLFARVFIDDAQIGALAFRRPISGPKKKPAPTAEGARLKRYKRVFLSYSSNDREVVSAIATAYQIAGVAHFWDRTSLKSGEEWGPRLRKEIDKADLFHLCWSKSASASQWVEKEAEHALTRRKRSNGKQPDITVQMLDGPPWAAHPAALDSINFDDFVRAAIVGYARGEEG